MSTYVRTLRTANADPEPLDAVLFGKTRRRTLGWLFTHPDESFYVREIVKATEVAQGAISRDLRQLTDAGILRRTVRGREVYYQAADTCPIYPELKSLFAKTAGLASALRNALRALDGRIRFALVHGSAARGGLTSGSDIDLIIVGTAKFGDVVDALHDVQRKVGREINPTVYSIPEFRDKKDTKDHFVSTVLREPHFFLLGGPGDLERLGQERLAARTSNERSGNRKPLRRRRPGNRRQPDRPSSGDR